MKKVFLLNVLALFLASTFAFANEPDPCPCEDSFTEVQVYYFGPDNVTINAYNDSDLDPGDLIVSFPNVVSGQLLTISGAGLPSGKLGTRTYLTYTFEDEECITSFYTRCPSNVWPNAIEEMKVLGKTFGNFTVYSYTDVDNSECNIDNAAQDWHVGGNVVGPENKTLGTRNNEDVVIISNDTPRGIITRDGLLGWGTQSPSTEFDLQGNALIEETLTVNGQTSINDVTPSTDASNGALTVAGGTGIAGNTNIGENLDVRGTATIGNNLTVESTGLAIIENGTQSNTSADGALTVAGGTGIGMNLFVGGNINGMNNALIHGNVQIGLVPNPVNYRLAVDGRIICEELRVRNSNNWPDYVFADDYELMPLSDLETFIQENKHLPGIPSALSIEGEGGFDLGEMQRKQMEKIEELTLYTIDLQNQNNELKAKLDESSALLEMLLKRVEQLEQK